MGQVVEKEDKKILWDWEHKVRTHCKARKPDLTLENQRKKEVNVVDMACQAAGNKRVERNKNIQQYQQLCFYLRKRRQGYKVKVIRSIIGCCSGGQTELKKQTNKKTQKKRPKGTIGW